MGKFSGSGAEQAQTVLSGTLTSVTTSANVPFLGRFNFSLWGVFSATANLQKSFDGGTTWIIARDVNGVAMTLTAADTRVIEEVEPGVLYQVACSAFTSGTINYRVSEGASRGYDQRLS